MLRIERPDYRRSKELDLLAGLRSRDPLALAETYHRTSPAAHACARRLLGSARATEALLHAVYTQVWASPPEGSSLEGWVRSRCFRLGTEHLREQDQAPAAPSLALLLPDLPAPDDAMLDPAERALADLPEDERRVLLLAHDAGMPTEAQDNPDASAALNRALMALAGSGEGVDDGAADECADVTDMADWTLGLLDADRAAQVSAEVVDSPACTARSRALRRGRRRVEGLPAAPDLGQRVLASVLGSASDSSAPARATREAPAEEPTAGAPAPPSGGSPTPLSSPAPPAPSSSLGEAPVAPVPFASLPSALDEEPPAQASDDAVEAPEAESGDATGTHDAAEAGHWPDHTEDFTPARPSDDDLSPPAADDTSDDERWDQFVAGRDEPDDDRVDVFDEDADEDDDRDEELHLERDRGQGGGVAEGSGGQPGGSRLVRQVLNVLAVIVVLAAGGALGLLIGILLVR